MGNSDEQDLNEYGLYDPEDEVWLGCNKGPFIYTDYDSARIAAQISGKRLGTTILPLLYDKSPKKLKDYVTPDLSGEEALKLLEEGEL